MLDCEPSDEDKGGVLPPELEVVQVLEREWPTGPGREKTDMKWTRENHQVNGDFI